MFRNLLILLVFLGVGFGANVAQSDIFVRQSSNAESDEGADAPKKTNIFLRPFIKRDNKSERMRKRMNKQLEISNVRRKIASDMQALAYWQQADREPKTLEELRSYATALRSKNVARVLADKTAMVSKLEAMRAKNLSEFRARINEQAPDTEGLAAVNKVILAGMAAQADNPAAKATQAVYKAYGEREIERVRAMRLEEETPRVQTTPKIAPIYRRSNASSESDSDKPSSAASGVYKNYR